MSIPSQTLDGDDKKNHPDATLHIEPPLYSIIDQTTPTTPLSAVVRRPSSILSSAVARPPPRVRRRLPSSSIARRRPRARRDVDVNIILRIASGSARARPRACHRARRDHVTARLLRNDFRGAPRPRIRARARRDDDAIEVEETTKRETKNVRFAIVERGAYLGRPRALNHSLVIHHVRHHGPVRRRRANARRAVTSRVGGDGRRGGGWGAM